MNQNYSLQIRVLRGANNRVINPLRLKRQDVPPKTQVCICETTRRYYPDDQHRHLKFDVCSDLKTRGVGEVVDWYELRKTQTLMTPHAPWFSLCLSVHQATRRTVDCIERGLAVQSLEFASRAEDIFQGFRVVLPSDNNGIYRIVAKDYSE